MAEHQQKDSVTRAPESGDPEADGPITDQQPAAGAGGKAAGGGPVSPGQAKVGEDYESGNPSPK